MVWFHLQSFTYCIPSNSENLELVESCRFQDLRGACRFQDLRGETGMNHYLIYILTLFLELMYFMTQQVSYHPTIPCSSVYYYYSLNVDDHFVSHPFTDYLPISIYIVIALTGWHTTAPILARFWWSVRDGDLSSRKFFWGGFHIHIPQPQVPTKHSTSVLIGRSVASTVSDKLVGFVYAVVIIWLSFLWSSGVWSVWNWSMVSPSCHHAKLLHYRGIFSLLKLHLTS